MAHTGEHVSGLGMWCKVEAIGCLKEHALHLHVHQGESRCVVSAPRHAKRAQVKRCHGRARFQAKGAAAIQGDCGKRELRGSTADPSRARSHSRTVVGAVEEHPHALFRGQQVDIGRPDVAGADWTRRFQSESWCWHLVPWALGCASTCQSDGIARVAAVIHVERAALPVPVSMHCPRGHVDDARPIDIGEPSAQPGTQPGAEQRVALEALDPQLTNGAVVDTRGGRRCTLPCLR